jgi:hypothetical protein
MLAGHDVQPCYSVSFLACSGWSLAPHPFGSAEAHWLDDGDRRLRFQRIAPARPSPLLPLPDDTAEESATTEVEQHAPVVMSLPFTDVWTGMTDRRRQVRLRKRRGHAQQKAVDGPHTVHGGRPVRKPGNKRARHEPRHQMDAGVDTVNILLDRQTPADPGARALLAAIRGEISSKIPIRSHVTNVNGLIRCPVT